ncbi:predicted hydrolase [Longilinea arvoryzae]|uniref:Predicted hydrolase n=1 Tax=Longilinea arvoryzae TaxID=360412 RepID=A0A0S7BF42_9CHLR|nr:HAD family hydrolase [Longilinea arvoryzae]GAP13078.1 predicted hydrolase [Longilinea arvoryzae]
MKLFDMIAFDADDTLWENEVIYLRTRQVLERVMEPYRPAAWVAERLYQTEMRNLKIYGYGIKSYGLSLVETAIQVSDGRVTGREIQSILDAVKSMLTADIQLLPHVAEIIPRLALRCPLMLITKGELLDQEAKVNRSGLGKYFQHVEIVSDKTESQYAGLLAQHAIPAGRFLMVGNSLRSDVLPVLALGGSAVYIPHPLNWAHENGEKPDGTPGFYELEHIGLLPELVQKLEE